MRKFLEEEMNHKIIFGNDNAAYAIIIKGAFGNNIDKCTCKVMELSFFYNDPMMIIKRDITEGYDPIKELSYKYAPVVHASFRNGISIYRDYEENDTKYSFEVNIDNERIESKVHSIKESEPGYISIDVFTQVNHEDKLFIDRTLSSEITKNEENDMVSILFLNGYNIPIVRTYPDTKEAEKFSIENIDKLFVDKSLALLYDDITFHELVSEQKIFIDCKPNKYQQDTDFKGMVNNNGIKIIYGNQGQDIETFHVELNEEGSFVTAYYQRLKSNIKAPDKVCGLSKDTLDILKALTILDFKMPELPNITYAIEHITLFEDPVERTTITYVDRSGIKFKYFVGTDTDTFVYADPYCTTVFKLSGDKVVPVAYYGRNMEQTRIWIRDIQGIPVFFHNPNVKSDEI